MYCVRCGVELQQGAERCPLCSLRVYHPDIQETPEPAPYPRFAEGEAVSHGGLLFILSFLFVIPAAGLPAHRPEAERRVTWSGYVSLRSAGAVSAAVSLSGSGAAIPWFSSPSPWRRPCWG